VLRFFELIAVVDWAWTFRHPARRHKYKAIVFFGEKRTLFIAFRSRFLRFISD
jgi:hypothetical protein